MRVTLNPPSGKDNSYYDIRYSIELEKADLFRFGTLRAFNLVDGSQIRIEATTEGVLDSDGVVHLTSVRRFSGVFSLFGDDRMNTRLAAHPYVDIRFELSGGPEVELSGGPEVIESIARFYNESHSADGYILPFDMQLLTPDVDLSSCQPLRMAITATEAAMLKFAVTSPRGDCEFFVMTREGRLEIDIPAPYLCHELGISSGYDAPLRIAFMKRHGVTVDNTVSFKKLPIPGTEFHVRNQLSLVPQEMVGFSGPLGDEFTLSDRYFVPTPVRYSNLPTKRTHPLRERFAPDMKYELAEIGPGAVESVVTKRSIPEPAKPSLRKSFERQYRAMAEQYRPKYQSVAMHAGTYSSPPPPPSAHSDCGCSRKKGKKKWA